MGGVADVKRGATGPGASCSGADVAGFVACCSESAGSARLVRAYDAGFVYGENDTEALAACLRQVAEGEGGREIYAMRPRARRLFEEAFAADAFATQLEGIAREVEGPRPQSALFLAARPILAHVAIPIRYAFLEARESKGGVLR